MSEAKTKQKACEEVVHSGTASAPPTIGHANVAASDRDGEDQGVPPLVGSSKEDDEDEATDMCPFGGHKCDLCYYHAGAYAPCDTCMPCTDDRCGPFAADPFTGMMGSQHHCINACPH